MYCTAFKALLLAWPMAFVHSLPESGPVNTGLTLEELLGQEPLLQLFSAKIQADPDLKQKLSTLKQVTIFAPTDAALAHLEAEQLEQQPFRDLFNYATVKNVYFASNFTDEPAFLSTQLINSSVTNVTTGQVIGASRIRDGPIYLFGGVTLENVTSMATVLKPV